MGKSVELLLENTKPDALTGMLKEYINIKNMYKSYILFFQVGSFFEAYFDDGYVVSDITGIVLTSKKASGYAKIMNKGNTEFTDDNDYFIPFAGVPLESTSKFFNLLLKNGKSIVLVSQLEDPKDKKGSQPLKRGVTKILTKGTILEEDFLDSVNNNFLCVISDELSESSFDTEYSLCFGDSSTDEVYLTTVETIEDVYAELCKYKPVEVYTSSRMLEKIGTKLKDDLKLDCILSANDSLWIKGVSKSRLEELYDIDYFDNNVYALWRYITYVEAMSCETYRATKKPVFYSKTSELSMNSSTRRNLELCENITDKGVDNTLYSVLNRCSTNMGKRKLKQCIERPLYSKKHILERYDAVNELMQGDRFKEISDGLYGIEDIPRLVTRIVKGTYKPTDVIKLCKSLELLGELRSTCGGFRSNLLNGIEKSKDFSALCSVLNNNLVDEPILDKQNICLLKEGSSSLLDELKIRQNNAGDEIKKFETRKKNETGIPSYTVKNKIKSTDYYISVRKKESENIPKDYEMIGGTGNLVYYTCADLVELSNDLASMRGRVRDKEIELYEEILEEIRAVAQDILSVCDSIELMDLLCSFARVSKERGYNRPNIVESDILSIDDGKHPVVCTKVDGYTANSIQLESGECALITGPNMAGKSTYMRQVALLVIMAQIGCYVPARSMTFKLVDSIFTRIGASDDITAGKSTYMVEMLEVSSILESVTDKSLVLLDEVGRGTGVVDGVCIARALIEYLVLSSKCKTMFATHFHELPKLVSNLQNVKNLMAVVELVGGKLNFLHRIEQGVSYNSYGIEVAMLAGLPTMLIKRAEAYRLGHKSANSVFEESTDTDLDTCQEGSDSIC